jgi:hypothetical protein
VAEASEGTWLFSLADAVKKTRGGRS